MALYFADILLSCQGSLLSVQPYVGCYSRRLNEEDDLKIAPTKHCIQKKKKSSLTRPKVRVYKFTSKGIGENGVLTSRITFPWLILFETNNDQSLNLSQTLGDLKGR
jgi:hypothetical protein